MNENTLKAYNYLVPADQLIIDALILTLYKKERQNHEMAKEVMKFLEERTGEKQ